MKKNVNLEEDFTGGSIHSLSIHKGSTKNKEIDNSITNLVASWGIGQKKQELIEELIITAYKIGQDKLHIADLKLINRALKEMREPNRVFTPYRKKRKVVVFGSARTQEHEPAFKAAIKFAKKMRQVGYMGITGAGEGIMGAAQIGSGRDNSFGLNILLPFEQKSNETIAGDPKLVNFNYFFTRKLSFIKESHAVAHFPGGLGTMDECFETLTLIQTGKSSIIPIVMVDPKGGTYWKTWLKFIKEHLLRLKLISKEDLFLFKITDNIDVAVKEILDFYKNFHSYRFLKDKIVIRLNKKLKNNTIKEINKQFKSLLKSGKFEQTKALPAERNEEEILDLPRLTGYIYRNSFGTIRQLIDKINSE